MLGANVALRRRSAEARYAVACIALVLLLAMPLVTFCVLLSSERQTGTPLGSPIELAGAEQAPTDAYAMERETAVVLDAGPAATPEPAVSLAALISSARSRFASLIPWMISIWLLGVLVLSGRFVGGLVVAERLKRADSGAIP